MRPILFVFFFLRTDMPKAIAALCGALLAEPSDNSKTHQPFVHVWLSRQLYVRINLANQRDKRDTDLKKK